MTKGRLVFVVLFIFCSAVFFFYTVEQDKDVVLKTKVSGEEIVPVSQNAGAFYMKLMGNQVTVYRADHSVYEYTDLSMELLPEHVIKELLKGKYFKNEAELYEFLETYTS